MGNSSSRTIAEMGISAKVNQASNASSETTCDSMNINSIYQNIDGSKCQGAMINSISGVKQDNNSKCKNASKQISISNQKADQDLQQQLTQVAEAKTKGVNLGNSSSAVTETNTQLNSSINLENSISQSCSSHALNLNQIRQSITNSSGEKCINDVRDIDQKNISQAINECSLKSDQSQASSQVIKQTVSQTATATTEGFDPVALLVMVAIILLILFVGPAYTISKIASAGLTTFLKVFMLVVIGILIAIYAGIFFEWFKSSSINQYSEIPWYIKIPLYLFFGYSSWSETPDNYYEIMKSEMINDTNSTPHNDGIYIINYSSVHYIPDNLKDTINSSTTLEEIKKLGLQNENLYGEKAKNNNGKVDSKYGYNSSYNPKKAKEFMENEKDSNKNPKYHAFEIICYVISKEGEILKLDNPITLFYDKLDETFWNYDSIKNPGCLDSSDSENYTSCGISLPKSRTECKTHDDCGDGEFCGLGDIGCVSCDYCNNAEDGIYGEEGTINPEESCIGVEEKPPGRGYIQDKKACGGVSGSKSLKKLLDGCKSCKGRILQQGEVYNEQNKIVAGTDPWNKVNYYNYTKAYDIWNNSYDSQGNIRFNDGKFEKLNGNSWNELKEMEYGFSSLPPSSSFNIDLAKTISDESEQNRIYFNSSISGNSEEKCIIRSVTWTEEDASVTLGQPSLSTLSGNKWSSTDESTTGSCYNVGVDDKYKCIDKYEVMCQNFPARDPNLKCDGSKVIDYTKTLVGAGEQRCAQLSLKDKITEEDWSECKEICCKTAENKREILFTDQVDCDYIPGNSIKIDQRFMPYNNNVVGIRMFRDYSEMGNKSSTKENLDKLVYWGWGVPLTIAIFGGLIYIYFHNKRDKVQTYSGAELETTQNPIRYNTSE